MELEARMPESEREMRLLAQVLEDKISARITELEEGIAMRSKEIDELIRGADR
jgi:hypothetical protein